MYSYCCMEKFHSGNASLTKLCSFAPSIAHVLSTSYTEEDDQQLGRRCYLVWLCVDPRTAEGLLPMHVPLILLNLGERQLETEAPSPIFSTFSQYQVLPFPEPGSALSDSLPGLTSVSYRRG